MIAFKVVFNGLKTVKKGLKKESQRQRRALFTAIKVEGFSLMGQLKKDIRRGKKPDRSYIARAMGKPGAKGLARLAWAVRYKAAAKPLLVRVGFVGDELSPGWKKTIEKQQAGFTTNISAAMKRAFFKKAKTMGPRSKFRKYLMIGNSPTQFRTPARPIMEPFWDQKEAEARRNIARNFKRKLKGQRI